MYANSLKYVFFMKFLNWERKGNNFKLVSQLKLAILRLRFEFRMLMLWILRVSGNG